jgi:hypothetical protein
MTGVFTLIVSLFLKKEQAQKVGCWIIFFCCLLAMPAFFSGEGAEERIEELPGVSHDLIHEHEEKAEVFIWLCAATGLLALFSALPVAENLASKKRLPAAVAVAGLITLFAGTQVGNSGGLIRHPEIEGQADTSQHSASEREQAEEREE